MILLEDNIKLWGLDLENHKNKDQLLRLNEIKAQKNAKQKIGKTGKLDADISFD